MTLFAEPAGGNFELLGWETLYGCPAVAILAVVAISVKLVRAYRHRGSKLEIEEIDRESAEDGRHRGLR